MKPLYHILVHIPSAVNETMKIGDTEIYVDTKFNEFQHRTMKAKVVGIPAKFESELEVGDYVFHHHHVAVALLPLVVVLEVEACYDLLLDVQTLV